MAADGSIIIDTRIDTKGFSKGSVNMQNTFGKIGSSVKKLGTLIGGAFAVTQIVQFGKEAVQLGSDLQEVQNVVDVTFTTMNEQLNEFASNAAKTAGLSETMAKKYAGTFGAMAKSFKFTEAESYEMSTALTQLAGDVASFYNITQDEAYTKLTSVFTGETETLKGLGVVMTQNALDAYAMANGYAKTTSEMTEQEKVALRYQFVMEQLSAASGDFERTSDGWANQTRLLTLQLDSLKATIGQGMINILTPVIKTINTLLSKMDTLANSFEEFSELITGNKGQDSAKGYSQTAAGIAEIAEATEDAAEATEAAKEAQDGYLSGLDEIQRYQDPSESDDSSVSLSPITSAESIEAGTDVDYGKLAKGATFFDVLIDKANELAGILNSGFFDGLGDYEPVIEDLRDDIESIGDSLIDTFTDTKVLNAADDFVDEVVYMFGAVVGAVSSIGLTIAQNLVGGIEKHLSSNEERIQQWLVDMFDIGAEISSLISQFSIDLADVFSLFGSDTAQQITANILGIFSELFLGVNEFVALAILDIVQSIVTTFTENKELIKESVSDSLGAIESITDSIKEGIEYITQTVLPGLNEGLEKLFDVLDPIGQFLLEVFFSVWNDMLNPALEYLGDEILPDLTETFENLWEDVLVPLGDYLSDILEPSFQILSDILSSLWRNIVVPLAKAIGSILAVAWEDMVSKLNNVVIPALSAVIATLQFLWRNALEPLVSYLVRIWGPSFESVFEAVGNSVDGLKLILSGITKFIGGVFTSDWRKALQGIREIYQGMWNSMASTAKIPINLIIGALNALVSGVVYGINLVGDALNNLSFDIPDWVPGIGGGSFGFNIPWLTAPQIPYLAKGAVIPPNAPFYAVLGDQKSGNNIETPEALLRKIVREETAGTRQGGGSYTFVGQINRRTLFEEFMDEAQVVMSQTGRNPFDIA